MNRTKKLCAGGMIVLSLVFLFPKPAKAQYVDIVQSVKEYGLDPVAWFVVNQVIKKIAAQTVNWINSGFKGNPAYVTDPRQFFLDIADTEASRFLSGTALNQLCSPFKAEVRLALVKNYLSEGNETFSCTLTKVQNNYEQFTRDFSVGGWDGWFEVTQNRQNNPYGSYLAAQDQLRINIGNNITKYQNQLTQGKGILSFEVCPPNQNVTQADIDAAGACDPGDPMCDQFFVGSKVGDCKVPEETATPGSVIEGQLQKVLGSGGDKLAAADEINEIITALLNQLVSRVVGGLGKGLRGASNPGPGGGPSFTDDLGNPALEPPNPASIDDTGPFPLPEVPPKEPVEVIIIGNKTPGGSCSDTGNVHDGALSAAIDAVLTNSPTLAESRNTKDNGFEFLRQLAAELSKSLNATEQVLNGNGNPNTGDLIAIWETGDTMMERYDVIIDSGSGTRTIRSSVVSGQFVGFIPLDCTPSGGNKKCGCSSGGTTTPPGTPTCTPPQVLQNGVCVNPTGNGGTLAITSVSPTSVIAGQTNITITGTSLTSTVQFFDASGARWSTTGTLNSGNTQLTTMVPAGFPTGSATVRVGSLTVFSNTLPLTVTGGTTTQEAPTLTPLAQINLGVGTFPDVTFFNGRIYLAVQQNGQMLLYSWAPDLTGQQVQQIPYQGSQAFPRLTVSGGVLWLAFREDGGGAAWVSLWRSDTGTKENLGGGLGNDPVALGNGFVAWQLQQANGTWAMVSRPLTGGTTSVVHASAPTGISRVLPGGSVVSIDEDRFAVTGHTMPWVSGRLTIAEGATGGTFGFINNPTNPFSIVSGSTFIVFPNQESFVPKGTPTLVGQYAVATWGNVGVRVALIQP